MKQAVLALFVSAGMTAMCQTATPNPKNPDKLFQMPPQFSMQAPNPGKGLGSGNSLKAMSLPRVLVAPPKVHMNQAEIDPGIIVTPPRPFGGRDKGTPVAQNLYPNLRLMPVEAGKLEPIPTEAPNLKVEQIPTQWPDERIVDVGAGSRAVKVPGTGK
jgi:hypothetical protein